MPGGLYLGEGTPSPQINMSKMPVGGGIAGAMVVLSSMVIFLVGIPALQYFLLAAIILGGGVALFIHFRRHETPGKAWIPAATKK